MAKVMTDRRRDPVEAAAIRALKPLKKIAPPKHLVELTKDINASIALVFWKQRNEWPEFSVTITEHDVRGFKESMKYQEQTPKLIIEAHQVSKAKPAVLVVRIADDRTGDQIRVSENNEADLDKAEEAKRLRRIKEQIPNMVSNALGEMSQGITSDHTIRSLCDAATALARA